MLQGAHKKHLTTAGGTIVTASVACLWGLHRTSGWVRRKNVSKPLFIMPRLWNRRILLISCVSKPNVKHLTAADAL